MKKLVMTIVVLAIIAITLGSAGYVYAQASNPPVAPGTGYATMAGGRGGRGGMVAAQNQDGLMHADMAPVYAEKLGISVEDLNARLANGETMSQIAVSKELTAEEFTALMNDARSQAVDQAVKDGTLTQAQADWMKQRGTGMPSTSGRRMRGAGQSQFTNPDCTYAQPNP
jgi:hypothetical protein